MSGIGDKISISILFSHIAELIANDIWNVDCLYFDGYHWNIRAARRAGKL